MLLYTHTPVTRVLVLLLAVQPSMQPERKQDSDHQTVGIHVKDQGGHKKRVQREVEQKSRAKIARAKMSIDVMLLYFASICSRIVNEQNS